MSKEDTQNADGKSITKTKVIGRKEKGVALSSGVLLALSIVAIDYLVLTFGDNAAVVLGWSFPANVMMSGLFVVSLASGILVGRAFIWNRSLPVVFYGGGWLIAMFLAYNIASVYGILEAALAPLALFLGGFALGLYRVFQDSEGFDELMLLIMFASTSLNLLYFIMGV